MGRKKRSLEDDDDEPVEEERKKGRKKRRRRDDSDDDSSSVEQELIQYDIDPEIQELSYTFGLELNLTQRLNDTMLGKRRKTMDQDIARLYEILKEARSPAAVLNLKLKDMEKGTFVGKAKCTPAVRDLAKKHRLDRGASTKLEEAMAMREALGKDIMTDIRLLDEHLEASNKPSALVSQKLSVLRKGYNIGHCIYHREPVMGNQGPGVDGVFNKKSKRALGYTDADLDVRFRQEGGAGAGGLMDEATIKRMMAEERKEHQKCERKRSPSGRSSPSRCRKTKGSSRSRSKSNIKGRRWKSSSSSCSSPPRKTKVEKEKKSKSDKLTKVAKVGDKMTKGKFAICSRSAKRKARSKSPKKKIRRCSSSDST